MRFSKKVYIAGAVILLLAFIFVPLIVSTAKKGEKSPADVAIVDQAATVSDPQLEQHVQEAPMVASTDPSVAVQALASQAVADIPAAGEKPAGSVAMPAAVTTDDASAETTAPATPADDSSITTSASDSQNAANASGGSVNPQTFGTVDDPASDSVIISPDDSGEQKRFPVRPSLMVRGVFDDNIFIAPNKTADFVWTVAPGLVYQTGDPTLETNNYLEVGFVPSVILYTDNSDQDAVNFDAWAKYDHRFNQLTLGISQRFQQISGSDIQAGNLVDRDIYTTQVTGNYDFSDKLNMDGALTQTISDYTSYNDINEWTAESYVYYKFLPKTSLGIGPKVGFVDVQPGPNYVAPVPPPSLPAPNQTYQQLVAKLIWDPTAKLRFNLSVGGELREFQDNAASTHLSPVFGLSGNWQASDATQVTLGGSYENNASPSQVSTNYAALTIYAKVRQRFLQKFYIGLSGGYENDSYSLAGSGAAVPPPGGGNPSLATREDNYYYIKPQFDCDITEWWGVTIFYQFRENDSNINTVSFNNNQVGIQTYLRY